MANPQPGSSGDSNKPLSKAKVIAGSRTYVFSVKTNGAGKRYLSITQQSSNGSSQTGNYIVIFQRHMQEFCKAFLKAAKQVEPKLKAYDVGKIRERYPNAFKPWTLEDDQRLIAKFKDGLDVAELVNLFQRGPGGIEARLKTLGLIKARRPGTSTGLRRLA